MECVVRVVLEKDAWVSKMVYNPGKYREPTISVREDTFYIRFLDEKIIATFTQPEGSDQIVNSQLEYQDGGIAFRFVTNNNEAILVPCSVRIFLAREQKKLARPPPLSQVIKLGVSKTRAT